MFQRRKHLRELLADLALFAVLHGVLTTLLFGLYRESGGSIAQTLPLLLPCLAMALIRIKVRPVILYIAGLLLLAGWPLLLPINTARRVILLTFMLIMAAYSFRVRLGGGFGLDYGFVLMAAAVAVIQIVFMQNVYDTIQPAAALLSAWFLVVTLCYLLYTHTLRLDESIDILTSVTKQPVGAMLRFNNGVIAVFLLLAVVAGLLAPLLPIEPVLSLFGALGLALVRWVVSFTNNQQPLVQSSAPVTPMLTTPREILDAYFGEPDGPPAWMAWLDQFIYETFWVVLAALVLGVIGFIVYRIYKRYRSARNQDSDIREYIGPAIRLENIGETWRSLRYRLPQFGSGEREKVRRLYFRKIRRHIRRGIKIRPADTAGEIAGKVRTEEDIGALTDTYNRARYSDNDIY
ncbi:MAG: DUF4129 domain-containing protein [Oscillospiraceae bacterium]|jgi:hypothetical protein|nr:DUF4129 domain-containing protein [Oscillospiraceae bacterium]